MKFKIISKKPLFISLTAALAAMILVFVMTSRFGVGISPDSTCYISIAENVVSGNGYAIYDRAPAVAWPPLYPTVLALSGLFDIDYFVWARILNILLAGGIVLLTSLWLLAEFGIGFLSLVGVLGTLLSATLLNTAKFAWTEPMFNLIVAIFLLAAVRSGPRPRRNDILVLSVLAGLAVMTRYIGVTLVAFYLLWLWLSGLSLRFKLQHSIIFGTISTAPLVFWLSRNYSTTATLTGYRESSSVSIFDNILYTLNTFSLWLWTTQSYIEFRIVSFSLLITALVLFLARMRGRSIFTESAKLKLKLFGLFTLIYVSYLITMASVVAFDRIDYRLLSPVYIPILLLVIVAINSMQNSKRWLKQAAVTSAVLWVIFLSVGIFGEIEKAVSEGAGGYSTTIWQNSELAEYLRENPPEGKTYSNFPDGVYALTGLPATMTPTRFPHISDGKIRDELDLLETKLDEFENVYLAWFTNKGRTFLYEPAGLSSRFEMVLVSQKSDGALYRIKKLNLDDG